MPSPNAGDPLVGRDAETARIVRAVAELAIGRGSILEFAGDPGIGKTSLLNVLAELAGRRGVAVARGVAVRGNRTYQVFRDAWLTCPELSSTPSGDDGFGLELHARLTRWAAHNGGVLILDDLHLCDQAAAELTAQLIRTPVPGPFVLALAHQPRQTAAALLEALDGGVRAGQVVRIELEPLDENAVAVLSEHHDRLRPFPDSRMFTAQLREASGGNPRNLRILAAAGWHPDAWPDSAGSDRGGLLREAVPLTVELDALTADAALTASVGAVLGDPFRPEDVAEVSGLGLDRTADALAELTRRDVVRTTSGSGRLTFRDTVLRHVAREHSGFGLRLAAHRRALRLFEKRGAPASVLARHAEHVVGADHAAGLQPLVDGAATILGQEPATAARWLRAALESLPGQERDPRWAELAIARCHALVAAGELAQARTLAHEVLRHPHALPTEARLSAHARCAEVERLLGHYPEAEAVADGGLALLPDRPPSPPSGATVELVFEHGLVHVLRGTPDRADALVRETLRAAPSTADGTDDRDAGTALRALAAFNDAYLGRMTEAAAATADCARIVDAMPDAVAGHTPELLALLGCSELYLERFADASRHLERGLAAASGGAQKHTRMHHLLGLAIHDQWMGLLEQSQRRAQEAENLAREIGAPDAVGLAMTMRAAAQVWMLGRQGIGGVLALAGAGLRSVSPRQGWWAGSAVGLLAQTQLMAGEADACRKTLIGAGGGEALPVLQPPFRPGMFALLSMAELRCGNLAGARDRIRDAQEAADALGLPVQEAYVRRARAALHAADGEHNAATKLFDEAAETLRLAGQSVQHVWTLVSGARSTAVALGTQEALDRLDTAVSIARPSGAQRIQEEAARVRRELLDGRVEARSFGGVPHGKAHRLSEREREIAELAASGMRSRQIAEQLFLSPRTVDAHLAQIYRKLDVSSRMALGAVLHPDRASAD